MRWFRSHIRAGSRLALCALAVQFCVTFAHVHLDGLVSGSTNPAAAVRHSTASLHDPGNTGQPTPGTADDNCPICALIQLANASPPSVAPPLPTPAALSGLKLEFPNDLWRPASPHFAFQARGPPLI
jgi:DUF2946 family protein